MKINWNPSPQLRKKIKYLEKLRYKKNGEINLSYEKISEKTGHHLTYIFHLLKWAKEHKGGDVSEKNNP